MKRFPAPWFIAGGWAIDLYLGRVSREHSDIEIAVFRIDQLKLHKHLTGWEFKKVEAERLAPWGEGEWLQHPVHEIHAHSPDLDADALEILLNESDHTCWIYRRNRQIKRELSKASLRSEDGIPYLAPEIVLLYKSKNPKSYDEADFGNTLPQLVEERRTWLRRALGICHPDHHWLDCLATG